MASARRILDRLLGRFVFVRGGAPHSPPVSSLSTPFLSRCSPPCRSLPSLSTPSPEPPFPRPRRAVAAAAELVSPEVPDVPGSVSRRPPQLLPAWRSGPAFLGKLQLRSSAVPPQIRSLGASVAQITREFAAALEFPAAAAKCGLAGGEAPPPPPQPGSEVVLSVGAGLGEAPLSVVASVSLAW
jgi:hypothetical protein